jgi:hypothetical protein
MTQRCRKNRHASERDALAALAKIQAIRSPKAVPQRAYLCPKCGFWHLTRQAA